MNESKAREILDNMREREDSPYCDMELDMYSADLCLDGYFTIDELEAIAWWMRNKANA